MKGVDGKCYLAGSENIRKHYCDVTTGVELLATTVTCRAVPPPPSHPQPACVTAGTRTGMAGSAEGELLVTLCVDGMTLTTVEEAAG
ncbi:Hypp2062 [Branchiostoma lanceolatum]|uniref:Hypp2062 protein n=1 Tax=Branchiostoma lanceolatum TaxID=7740 RepID=A0A8J9ZPZ2_BRALA|nr:Hypp2062 [Branchiostoma lanceolatum]